MPVLDEFMVVHPLSNRGHRLTRPASSGQATLRHPGVTAYRCFLPDLAGFAGSCRAGPSLQRRLAWQSQRPPALEGEFDPAIADCGYRAPLAPRLARPYTMLIASTRFVKPMAPVERRETSGGLDKAGLWQAIEKRDNTSRDEVLPGSRH